ncbi:MAG: NnrS family protein [Pseudomonadota bacterium]|nr:NnrS family protein [Pseudomonadota bacterium]
MAVIQIEAPSRQKRFPLLQLGFRPFFLLAALWSACGLALWITALNQGFPFAVDYPPLTWHAHEMIFGFATAVVTGFLLTAARNWTGTDTLSGAPLGGLSLLWLAGRLAPFSGIPPFWVSLVDLAFLPLAATAVALPIIRARQRNNLVFGPLLLVLFLANLLVHLELLGMASGTAQMGLELGIWLLVFLMTLMGGRVIPFFIERGLGLTSPLPRRPRLDAASLIAVGVAAAADLLLGDSLLLTVLAIAAGSLLAVRVAGWHRREIWRNPMLWILYLGYGWLAVGFLLTGAASFQLLPPSLATHAFTSGALGLLTLGMMARVSLGHTGRNITAGRALTAAFVLVSAASLVRVAGPLIVPASDYLLVVSLAGGLWTLAFAVLFIVLLPILTSPRLDRQPG